LDVIIKKLIAIETKADQIVRELELKRGRLPQQIEKLEHEIQQRIEKETQKKVLKMQRETEDDTYRAVAELKKTFHQRGIMLGQRYEANSKRWANELFEEVLGR